jgi:hypothetical protein
MIGSSEEIIRWLFNQDREKRFEIKEHKKKRSLDANAYCWVLLQKIADKLNSTKEEIYRRIIKEKGTFEILPIKDDIIALRCLGAEKKFFLSQNVFLKFKICFWIICISIMVLLWAQSNTSCLLKNLLIV